MLLQPASRAVTATSIRRARSTGSCPSPAVPGMLDTHQSQRAGGLVDFDMVRAALHSTSILNYRLITKCGDMVDRMFQTGIRLFHFTSFTLLRVATSQSKSHSINDSFNAVRRSQLIWLQNPLIQGMHIDTLITLPLLANRGHVQQF